MSQEEVQRGGNPTAIQIGTAPRICECWRTHEGRACPLGGTYFPRGTSQFLRDVLPGPWSALDCRSSDLGIVDAIIDRYGLPAALEYLTEWAPAYGDWSTDEDGLPLPVIEILDAYPHLSPWETAWLRHFDMDLDEAVAAVKQAAQDFQRAKAASR